LGRNRRIEGGRKIKDGREEEYSIRYNSIIYNIIYNNICIRYNIIYT
jgi:hypothetical protein